MFFPISSILSRVSIMIFLGGSSFPVIFAGHSLVQRPHSVHEKASIRFFQLRSYISFAPKPAGGWYPSGVGAEGSSISFTSLVTDSIFVNFPFGFRLE